MQLEMVHLNSVYIIDRIKSLINAVTKLSEDVTQLKRDTTALAQVGLQDLQGLVHVHSKLPKQQPQGSLSTLPGSRSY